MNDFLMKLYPAFADISDADLREKALKATAMAMEVGGWTQENIHNCPVSLNWEGCDVSLVEHVNDVVEMCKVEFDMMEKYYLRHNVPFSRDLVVCGALLHDIGKMTEFVWKDGEAVHGDNFTLMRHPLSGAIIAAKVGLPDEVVHLIATHSFEGDKSYQTSESTFVRTVDIFVFNNSVRGLKKKA